MIHEMVPYLFANCCLVSSLPPCHASRLPQQSN